MLITINGALHSCRIVTHCKAPFLFMDLIFINYSRITMVFKGEIRERKHCTMKLYHKISYSMLKPKRNLLGTTHVDYQDYSFLECGHDGLP